jgi:2-dehydro-3-deoxyphosphogluconate aldolase/(4S)-4-hydroxy-2-oxoglutarate aldolase
MRVKDADRRTLDRMLEEKVVAVVRLSGTDDGLRVAEALCAGGVRVIEIALTTPRGCELIRELRTAFPEAVIGAGTVMTADDVDRCVDVGAAFAVSPVCDSEIVRHARERGLFFSPGAYSPTEVYEAWKLGVPIVKVFPAARVGPKYIRDLKAPMPFLRLMPTGGVDDRTAAEFLNAGADVLGAGSWLVDRSAVQRRDMGLIEERATLLAEAVMRCRKDDRGTARSADRGRALA